MTARPYVVGLDLSLTATGVSSDEGTRVLKVGGDGMERLAMLRDAVLRATHVTDQDQLDRPCSQCWEHPELLVDGSHPDVVVVEGYSYASANQAHQLGELGGVVRLALWEVALPYVVVPPKLLKRYAAGNGNAGKDEMLAAAIRRLGYEGHDHNAADAMWLRAMALDHYGFPLCPMPAANRAALAKVAWPSLAVGAEA